MRQRTDSHPFSTMSRLTTLSLRKFSLLASAAALWVGTVANGATITWGTATAVSTGPGNSSDVSTNGTLVEAYSGTQTDNSQLSQTVNGVTFIASTTLLNGNSINQGDMSSATNGGDAAYDAILSTLDFGGGDSTTIVIGDGDGNTGTLSTGLLTVGLQYEIQVWFVDDRAGSNYDSRVMGYASSSSDTVVQLNDQFVIGTFTADATTQTLFLDTISPSSGFGNTHITAYQIRQIPEPSVPALIAGLFGLTSLRRRRFGS